MRRHAYTTRIPLYGTNYDIIVKVYTTRELFDRRMQYSSKSYQLPEGSYIRALFQLYRETPTFIPYPRRNVLGEVRFVLGEYGSGAVAHEMLHAVLCWGSSESVDIGSRDVQEDMCLKIEHLVIDFWNWHFDVIEKEEQHDKI